MGKRIVLTGTPMGGKLENLWGLLHYLNPSVFRSKWRWLGMWTDIIEEEYYAKGGKKKTKKVVGGSIRHCDAHKGIDDEVDGRPMCARCREIEEAFYAMLTPYLTRRTKEECMPWLPPKHPVTLWCDFGSAQHRKQYEEFQKTSLTFINDEAVTSSSVLEEFLRLSQFAGWRHEMRNGKLVPTEDSGKLAMLQAKLDELGIWDGETDEQAVIFSQYREVVDLVHAWLLRNDVPSEKISAKVSKTSQRTAIQKTFQAGKDLRCLVMTTTAGGVSITLDRASNVFILDETWDPDDQEQAADRCHRGSRIHQVTVYFLRTRKTFDEYKDQVVTVKSRRNYRVLDLKRIAQALSRR